MVKCRVLVHPYMDQDPTLKGVTLKMLHRETDVLSGLCCTLPFPALLLLGIVSVHTFGAERTHCDDAHKQCLLILQGFAAGGSVLC